MKTHTKILLIVVFIIAFTLIQPYTILPLMDMLPDSYALGVLLVMVDVFLYIFVPIKIWKLKDSSHKAK